MYDNIFENYDDAERPGVLYIHYNGNLNIRNCKFIKIRGKDKDEGFVFNCNNNDIKVVTENSEFINCGANDNRPLVSIMSASSSISFKQCKFIFDDISKSCRVLDLGTNDGIFDQCQFINCGEKTIYLTKGSGEQSPMGTFQFTNNYIKSNQGRFINAEKLNSKPIISGNTFIDFSLNNNDLMYISHNQNEIKLINNTFSGLVVGGSDESNCGSIVKIVENSITDFTISYENCKFNEINKKCTVLSWINSI